MANVKIEIPSYFNRDMRQFVLTVQQMQQWADKLLYSTQHLQSAQNLIRAHQVATTRMRQLNTVLGKISMNLQRALDSTIRMMGTTAQTFLRGLAVVSEALGPIIAASVTVATTITSAAITGATISYRFMRWAWDKMVDLGDSMLQDWLTSSGVYGTIGGLRAFRSVTAGLIDDPNMLIGGMAQARGAMTSPQFAALRMLGVKSQVDSFDTMTQAVIAAAQFMKKQSRGTQLRMAEAFAITSFFDPITLLRLESATAAEIKAMEENYIRYKPLMQISDTARENWINFRLQVQAAGAQIATVIGNKLADPTSPFVQALTKLSESVVHFMDAVKKSPLTDDMVNRLSKYLDDFAAWMDKPGNSTKIVNAFKSIGRIVKLIFEAVIELGKIIQICLGDSREAVLAKFKNRRRLARRLGIEHGTPETIPSTEAPEVTAPVPVAPPGPIFRPGVGPRIRERERAGVREGPLFRPHVGPRARVEAKREQERRKAVERGEPTTGGLRVPKTPAEAPETTEAATKGGFVRGGGVIDRSQFVKEMQDKPWLRQRAMEIAANEEGTNPLGTQMIVESAMNRAQVQGTSLEKQLKWTSEGGYYDDARGHGRAAATAASAGGKAVLGRSVDNALGGSNASGYATDNSSGPMAERQARTGQFKFIKKTPGGDSMFSPGSSEAGLIPKYDKWLAKQKGRTGGYPLSGMTTEDIQKGLREDGSPTAQGKSSTGAPTTAQGQPAAGAAVPGAKLAPSGQDPTAIIIHHTGDRHTAQQNVDIWRSGGQGIGAQYIVDRDGTVHDVEAEFGYKGTGHIHPKYTPQEFLDKGIVNKNVVGIEVTATSDKDITPAQISAVKGLVAKNYPKTPVYGHGEVNPGHREADEGRTIVQSIRKDRAEGKAPDASSQAKTTDGPARPVSGQVTQPSGTEANQASRPYRLQGTVNLGGKTYDWASGGHARGSIPYGSYPINIDKGDIGPVGQRIGSVATVGRPGGEIDDPLYPGRPREGIQIHPWSAPSLEQLKSDGCFTIPEEQWPAFKRALLEEAKKHPEGLSLTINRNGTANIEPYHEAKQRAADAEAKAALPEPVKVEKPPVSPPQDTKPQDDNPLYHTIVDNRSDSDVVHAKTTSDNDNGSTKSVPEPKPADDVKPADNAKPEKFANRSKLTETDADKFNQFMKRNKAGIDMPERASWKEFRRADADIDDRRNRTPNIRRSLGDRPGERGGFFSNPGAWAEPPAPSKLGADLGMVDILRTQQKGASDQLTKDLLQGQIDEYDRLQKGGKPKVVKPSKEEMGDGPGSEGTGHGVADMPTDL